MNRVIGEGEAWPVAAPAERISAKAVEKGDESKSGQIGDELQKRFDDALKDCLKSLKEQFPNLSVINTDLASKEDIPGLIEHLGPGMYLLVDNGVLDAMAADEDFRNAAINSIKDLLKRLSGDMVTAAGNGVKVWSAGIALNADRTASYWLEQRTENDKSLESYLNKYKTEYYKYKGRQVWKIKTPKGTFTMTITRRLNYSPASHLAQLARIRKSSSIPAFAAKVRAEMKRVSQNSFIDDDEKQAALVKMARVLQRASKKAKNLKEEERIQSKQEDAQQRMELEKAKKLMLELKRRRTARRSREYAQIYDKMPVAGLPLANKYMSKEEERYWRSIMGEALSSLSPVGGVPAGGTPVEGITQGSTVIATESIDISV